MKSLTFSVFREFFERLKITLNIRESKKGPSFLDRHPKVHSIVPMDYVPNNSQVFNKWIADLNVSRMSSLNDTTKVQEEL